MTTLAPHPHDIGPDPGAPLVDLPGHSSRGRLERVLRRGEFAVTAELDPPDSADAAGRLRARANLRGLGRRHQRDRRLGRALPYVERRDLRAADPRRLFAGPADLLPRLQSHRHSGQRAGRRGAGGRQHPVPDRRRRAMRRSSRGQAGLRPRSRPPCCRSSGACATKERFFPDARSPRRRASSSARRRTPSRRLTTFASSGSPRRSPRARNSSRRNIASIRHCCCSSWKRRATWGSTKNASFSSASGRSLRPRRRDGCAPMSPASIFPTLSSRGSKARRTSAPRASASASR